MTDFEEGENPAVTPKTNRGSIVRFHYMWLAVQLSAVGSSETEETQRFGSTVAQREERSVNSPQHLSLFHHDALRLWAQAEVMKIAKRYLQKGETIYETKTYAGGGHQVLIARFKK